MNEVSQWSHEHGQRERERESEKKLIPFVALVENWAMQYIRGHYSWLPWSYSGCCCWFLEEGRGGSTDGAESLHQAGLKSDPPGASGDVFLFLFLQNSRKKKLSFCHVLRLFEPDGCAHTDLPAARSADNVRPLVLAGLASSISCCEAKQHDM